MTDMATKYGPGLEESRETSPVYLASPGSAESVNLDLFYLVSVCERFDCTLGPRSNVSVYCPGAVADDCSDAGGLKGARGQPNGRPEVSAPCVRGGGHSCCGGGHVLVHSVDAGARDDFTHPDLVRYQ